MYRFQIKFILQEVVSKKVTIEPQQLSVEAGNYQEACKKVWQEIRELQAMLLRNGYKAANTTGFICIAEPQTYDPNCDHCLLGREHNNFDHSHALGRV
jgi:hypothetical protein